MPSIKEKLEKSKYLAGRLVKGLQNTWVFAGTCLILAAVLLTGSLRLSTLLKAQNMLKVQVAEAAFGTNISGKEGSYVASKSGKVYYFPWCGMVNRIKDANLVWFSSRTLAEASGYAASSNCNGLK